MDIKIIFATLATAIAVLGSSIPYFRDIISKKTHPHSFTWLIWAITQGTATAALWCGKGGFGVISPTIGTCSIIFIFLLSLRYGEKNITRSDIICLTVAILAILVWWLLNNPLISVILVCLIDAIAFIPTFRKSYNHPWSEKLSAWEVGVIASIFGILAISNYNALTLPYLLMTLLSSIIFSLFLIIRRRKIPMVVK
ncbi:MAG: hypothetical protein WC242_03230 [Candidatus Paceibacterota bacterium]|jgi:hypothetical protein